MTEDSHGSEASLVRQARRAFDRVEGPSVLRNPAAPPLEPDGYELIRELGRGGQGIVYQAVQRSTRQHVAVKVLRHGVLATPGEQVRLEREVRILAQLKHPGVVAIHDSGTVDGLPFYVMDYIDGVPLDRFVDETGLADAETLHLFVQVTDAVQAAHVRGVMHRDLKPSNILVDNEGRPFIVDFGLAKSAEELTARAGMTETGQFIGSLPWAAPEQLSGDGQPLDVRTDVYALGVILYRLLAHRFPYDTQGAPQEVAERIRSASPSSLRAIRRELHQDLEIIALKCLAKERERRYQSAGELAEDIRRHLNGDPIQARPPSFRYLMGKQFRRHRAAAIASVAVLLAILLGGGAAGVGVFWALAERDRAEQHAERARLAQIDAESRTRELEQVARFQSSQLSEVNPHVFGAALRRGILEEHRATLLARQLEPEAVESSLRDFETALVGLNFTNLGLEILSENVFEQTLKAIERDFPDQPTVKAQLLQSLADTLRQLGLLERATYPQEEALRIRRAALGHDHVDSLVSQRNLGVLLHAQGKLAEAEPLIRDAMEGHRRLLGDDHSETNSSISSMGLLLKDMGRLAEAESYYREALDGARRLLGNEHPDTFNLISNFGTLLRVQGKLAEAEPYYREALGGFRRILGDEHPDTLISLGSLGGLLKDLGRLAEAETYYREALDGHRRVLGDTHPDTLTSINNMGGLLYAQGKPAETEPYYREALDARRRVLGDDHPHTLVSINNMGFLLQAQGKRTEAEPYWREALDRRRRVLGDDHLDTLTSMNNMGFLLDAQGRLDEAEPYFREALEKRRRLLGDNHPHTLGSITNMGGLLRAQGSLAEAEPYYREALEGYRRVLGEEHSQTLVAINNLGILLCDLGRLDEAEPFMREALEGRRRVRGDDDPNTLFTMDHLGSLLRGLERYEEAEGLGAEAVGRARRVLPPGHWHMSVFLLGHARTLLALERFAEAEGEMIEAHGILVEALGNDHPRTTQCTEQLASLYDTWHAAEPNSGYDAKAAEWRARALDPNE